MTKPQAPVADKKVLYHVFFQEFGEWDAFFDEDDKLVTYWHCNDANWRSGYMDGVVEFFGGEVISLREPTKRLRKVFAKEMAKQGIEE